MLRHMPSTVPYVGIVERGHGPFVHGKEAAGLEEAVHLPEAVGLYAEASRAKERWLSKTNRAVQAKCASYLVGRVAGRLDRVRGVERLVLRLDVHKVALSSGEVAGTEWGRIESFPAALQLLIVGCRSRTCRKLHR